MIEETDWKMCICIIKTSVRGCWHHLEMENISNPKFVVSLPVLWEFRYSKDRPFNLKGGLWFFVSFRIFFSNNTRVRILILLLREARIFFPEFNIRLYDKNSESYYFFFPLPKSKYFFQQHWESEYFFRKKP